MKKRSVPEVMVRAVMSLYEGTKTRVSVGQELSEEFEVKVGVHQGSMLSPLVFAIVVDVVTESVRSGSMSEMLYVDDLVLMSETVEGLREKIWKWKEAFESKGLKVNLGKTKVLVSGVEGEITVLDYLTALTNTYDINNFNTWKSVCTKCSSFCNVLNSQSCCF